ncbi:MAG: class E sortase [Arsenicicoccus sp.]|nr:MAG: class E sortase [Arsenicicoccus sp.]
MAVLVDRRRRGRGERGSRRGAAGVLRLRRRDLWRHHAGRRRSAGRQRRPDDTTTDTTWAQGEDLALVHLPTVGELRPVAQGVDLSILNLGVLGHYPSSDLPGEVGNFAVAGHRTTYGAPLWSIGELQPGDPVVVETQEGWFVYALDRTQVIAPTQTEVIAAVPGDPAAEPTKAWMVLTACHPKFSAAQRIAAFALLDRFVPRADGAPPEVGA